MEILETLARHNAEGRPIWKPMHMQPIFRMNGFVTREAVSYTHLLYHLGLYLPGVLKKGRLRRDPLHPHSLLLLRGRGAG